MMAGNHNAVYFGSYISFDHSQCFDYCSQVWAGIVKTLQRLQNRATEELHPSDCFKNLNLLNLVLLNGIHTVISI